MEDIVSTVLLTTSVIVSTGAVGYAIKAAYDARGTRPVVILPALEKTAKADFACIGKRLSKLVNDKDRVEKNFKDSLDDHAFELKR